MGNVNIKYNNQSVATMYDKGIIRLTGNGKVNNGNIDVTYTPDTTPSVGFVPTAYDSSGRITDGIWYGENVPYAAFKCTSSASNGPTILSYLEHITLDASTTIIDTYAFNSSLNLVSITLSPNLTKIKDRAFQSCRSLQTIDFPNSLKEIGNYGLSYCVALNTITLPPNIRLMGRSFEGCSGLTSVTFLGTKDDKPYFYGNDFNNCPNLTTINVPWAEGTVSGAPWGATNATINYNYTPS